MAGAAVFSDRLFVVGGSTGLVVHDSAEVYDSISDTWSRMAPMSHARSGLGVAVLSGTLYALGGYDGTANLVSVESYDEDLQEWTLQPAMPIARRRFGFCSQLT